MTIRKGMPVATETVVPRSSWSILAVCSLVAACSDPSGDVGPAIGAGGGSSAAGGAAASGGAGVDVGAGGAAQVPGGGASGAGAIGGIGGGTTSGAGGGGSGGPSAGGATNVDSCPTSGAYATKIEAKVHWAQTATILEGSGTIRLWSKDVLQFSGGQVTGTTVRCGQVFADFEAPPAFVPFLGGSKLGAAVPDESWDKPSMPKAAMKGTVGGTAAGAAFTIDEGAYVLGMNMSDPSGPWPSLADAQAIAVDADGDRNAGFSQIPRSEAPFARPPVSLADALNASGLRADRLYGVFRFVSSRAGTLKSCTSIEGTATGHPSKEFHLVGCHVFNGGECDATQVQFADTQLTAVDVIVDSETFAMKKIDDGANCSAVRAAVP